MTAGRPPEFTTETLELAKAYLLKFSGQGEDDLDDLDEAVPTIEGLAISLDVSRNTVYRWAQEEGRQEFSDIVDMVRTLKSHQLQNKSLKNELNASIAKLLLGHEGYRENHDHTTDGKALPTPIISLVKENEDK